MKPYYDEDGITIYHGDCREIAPRLDWNVVVTDPPYGIALRPAGRWQSDGPHAPRGQYVDVHEDEEPFDPGPWLRGFAVLWGANHYASRLPDSSGWLVWDKLRPDEFSQSRAELAWSNCHKGVRVFQHLWNGMLRDSERGPRFHPTQKPVALMVWCLSYVDESMLILDPYMGAGPIAVAAKQLGRRYFGIEIEERYCEIAAKRLSQKVLDWSAAEE